MIKKLIRIFSARTAADSEQKAEDLFVSQHSSKPNVTSRFVSSDVKERLKSTDKHWSEMSAWEKVEAGPFLCILHPDEYDKRWGKHLEYFTIFKNEEEYYEQKNSVIASGRWAEFVQQ